jgi:hypothetical protein
MCTTCSHDVVVGFGGSVVVLVVLVVVVVVVDVVDVVEDVVDVVAATVEDGGTNVLPGPVDEEDDPTLVGAVPSADWIRSLHAVIADSATSTSAAVAARFIPRSRPTGRLRVATLPPGRAPSTRRDGR